MNWQLKILIKLLLSHLPLKYGFWQRIGLFRLGEMDQAEYAEKIFRLHSQRAYPEGIPADLTFLELGPGDSIASAIIANACGVGRIYLVDSGDFATRDMTVYRSMVKQLQDKGLPMRLDMAEIHDFNQLLEACNATYLTQGLDSLKTIHDRQIDFVWSHSVLEHIRKRDFPDTFREIRRIIKSGGMMSHNVDLMDHLGGGLNNLRFPEWFWENDFVANSGFYTNRIRYSEMLAILKDAGFCMEESNHSNWPELPISRSSLATPFHHFSDQELMVRCCHFLVRPCT